ncbi:hypothetical protein [Sorangium sp. So ce1000]|uniref:hypothetical protein n=1 Tax=Sorangium sp. So ce1000 TaxID=3133325 RepID=UPI003F61C3E0
MSLLALLVGAPWFIACCHPGLGLSMPGVVRPTRSTSSFGGAPWPAERGVRG